MAQFLIDVQRRDTICAAATPPARSALGLIRVSGPDAWHIKEQIFIPRRPPQKPFVATLGDVVFPLKEGAPSGVSSLSIIDEGICLLYPAHKSYTGESAFELSIHGSPILLQQVLAALMQAGCRLAEPGEFSRRAVLSGKMDLCAAEAVADLIESRSVQAAQAALRNLKGGLEDYIEKVRTSLIHVLCEIEARLDFPEEGLGTARKNLLASDLHSASTLLQHLLDSAPLGERLMEGARVALWGAPNAGKSTLLNVLLKEERALVHHSPGTTRDVLEASWMVRGIAVTLVDVAGIRCETGLDPVEVMGIRKAERELAKADMVLWLIDGTQKEKSERPLPLPQTTSAPVFTLYTKADLLARLPSPAEECLWISAHNGYGLNELQNIIYNSLVQKTPAPHQVLLTRSRQKEEVKTALTALTMAKEALSEGEIDEVVAAELRACTQSLDRLVGKSCSEEILDLIFTRFCIGK